MPLDEQFEVPSHAEVVVITHVLELPRDLGLPDDLALALFEERTDAFVGWHDEAKAALVGVDALPTPGRSPTSRFVFRRRYAPERAQLVAAHLAFADWLAPRMDPDQVEEMERQFSVYMSHGSFGWISVVAATRFVPVDRWPDDLSERAAVQGAELEVSLSLLNDYLLALSLARTDLTITPVALGELPRVCPVILETVPMSTAGERNSVAFPYVIHGIDPHKYGSTRSVEDMDEDELRAADLAKLWYFGDEPWPLFYEMMQRAEAGLFEGRIRAAAVDLGTAVEILFSVALRESALVRGLPLSEVERLLELPLRNQVEHHIPKYVRCVVDLADGSNVFGQWWASGYLLRNRIVHDGYRPTGQEVRLALDEAKAVVESIAEALAADPLTQHLSTWLGRAYPGEGGSTS